MLKSKGEWKRGNPGFTSQKTGVEGTVGEGKRDVGGSRGRKKRLATDSRLPLRVVEYKPAWRLLQQ